MHIVHINYFKEEQSLICVIFSFQIPLHRTFSIKMGWTEPKVSGARKTLIRPHNNKQQLGRVVLSKPLAPPSHLVSKRTPCRLATKAYLRRHHPPTLRRRPNRVKMKYSPNNPQWTWNHDRPRNASLPTCNNSSNNRPTNNMPGHHPRLRHLLFHPTCWARVASPPCSTSSSLG